ncbi:PaaI family thioesterase [Geobacter argillaceus]|uniref:PaaI family thioesterase n=1 Tax=Geobacter argillaceus TaxID=345631 RepID=UPI001FE4E214|nr:PaaI family thioesterase [Geobacter argillaceus]
MGPEALDTDHASPMMNNVRPAVPGDTLTARSELIHLGRRMASITVTILDQNQKLVAHGTVSLMVQ